MTSSPLLLRTPSLVEQEPIDDENDLIEWNAAPLDSERIPLSSFGSTMSLATIDDGGVGSLAIGDTPAISRQPSVKPISVKSSRAVSTHSFHDDGDEEALEQGEQSTSNEVSSLQATASGVQDFEDLMAITAPQEASIDRDAVIAKIKEAIQEREKLKMTNLILQHKLAEYYKKKRDNDEEKKKSENGIPSSEQDQRYMQLLQTMSTMQHEYDVLQQENSELLADIKDKSTAKMEECKVKLLENSKYRTSIAAGAENIRTGKPIPRSTIEQVEALEMKKSNDVIVMRLENYKLRNKLKRQEQILKHKEELAEGLHLIDFEQLKIENQTYIEKIEERNDELARLKSKISYIVQTLTHVKEKLACKNEEQGRLREELATLDAEVRRLRDALPQKKKQVSILKKRHTDLIEKGGLTGNEALLRDFEIKFDSLEEQRKVVQRLEKDYSHLADQVRRLKIRAEKKKVLGLEKQIN